MMLGKKAERIKELERENESLLIQNKTLEYNARHDATELKRLHDAEKQKEAAIKCMEIAHDRTIRLQAELKQRDSIIEQLRQLNASLEGEYRMYQIMTEGKEK